ncbi:hypothetical protein [Chryseobacterium arthrosphaerae]|uniref:hypothetical protein n=1 Tax=Chryseobacterium arthrosphaerae TaxID=651561 RepID=UPI001E5F83DD|nr:hypothetical protein [Chryseobacterium arthrosphaerae]UEQ76956.1 hypothetical protein J8N07_01250 [Chryseobacterium arthrosphaerae]
MKNIFFIIIIFCGGFSKSQIKLEFKLDFNSNIADITVVNNTTENYVFPLDRNFLRPYDPVCANYQDYEENFPGLGLMLMIEEQQDENKLLTYHVESYVDPSKFDSITKDYQKRRLIYEDLIRKWKRKTKIENTKNAKINYDIVTNLVFLKPNERINYKIKVNTNNITDQKFKFYSYLYNPLKSYKYYLEYCNASRAYEYLTKEQKKNINRKGYKLFYGVLKSNMLSNR